MKPFSQKTSSLFFGVCLFVVASASRLFSLGPRWTSDEAGWLDHSTVFMAAVEMGAFSETLVTFHPGVITMWLAALRTFFTEPHNKCSRFSVSPVVHRNRSVNRDWCRSGAAVSVIWALGCTPRRGVSILLSTLFSPIPSRPHRCVGSDFCPVSGPVPPALLWGTPKTPLPHRFWNCVWSSLPRQKQLPYSSLVGAYLLRPVSESGGDVAAVLSPGAWSGPLFPELHVTHRFRAVAPLLEPRLFGVWDVSISRHAACVSGVTERGASTTHPIFDIGCGGRCGIRLYGRNRMEGVRWCCVGDYYAA